MLTELIWPLCGIQEKPTRKQRIWFLPIQEPKLKNPKELFFANALNEIKKEETEI
jgi:hypothetical protein